MAELQLILNLLGRILAHEFELRLTVCFTNDRTNPGTNSSNSVCAVDAAIVGLGFILPMISEQMLMVSSLHKHLCMQFHLSLITSGHHKIRRFCQDLEDIWMIER